MTSLNAIVLVASVSALQEDKVLIIQESKPHAYKKWNFPSGRIEQGEDILKAACREMKEETGFDVRLTKTTGIYNFRSSSNHHVIMFHFIGQIIGGSLTLDETEILDSQWVRVSDLLQYDISSLRNPGVIKQIAERLQRQQYYPTDIFVR